MRIALVHDFLTQLGGAERVLEELHSIFPEAPVFTLVHDATKTGNRYKNWNIKTSFLQKLPGGVKHYKWYLPLMPSAVGSFNFDGYDLVISDSSAYVKGIKVTRPTRHLCYCHTPTRYLWQDKESYLKNLPYPFWIKWGIRPLLSWLKRWDFRAAQKPDLLIANSLEVKRRIQRYYNREARVIYPGVDTDFFTAASGDKKEYFLAASRLEPYKKIGLVVEAFTRLNLPLKVAGSGSVAKKVQELAGSNVEFLGHVSDDELKSLYQGARAFVFPALEDAGLMILEALATGTPVLAYGAGGALEFIDPGKHGEFFYEQNVNSILEVVKKFDGLKYRQADLTERAKSFSKEVFRAEIKKAVNELMSADGI